MPAPGHEGGRAGPHVGYVVACPRDLLQRFRAWVLLGLVATAGIGLSFLYLLPGFFWPCGSDFLPYGDLLLHATARDVEEAYDKLSADYHNSDDGIGSDNCVDDDCDGPGVALLRFFSRPPA